MTQGTEPASPRIRFLVGGVQKGGTTALAQLLARHPGIALPDRLPSTLSPPGGDMALAWRKEAHVFDAPGYDDQWSVADVDQRFAARFEDFGSSRVHGDATPVTAYHPRTVARVQRYNPAMRWILLLRDPVARAISHHAMERDRGNESLGLFRAVLSEPARLRGTFDDLSASAAWRHASYVDRGRYVRQLDELMARFPAEQVLLLRSIDLATHPLQTARRALAFLGLPDAGWDVPVRRVLEGAYVAPSALSPARLLLRWRLRGETARLRGKYGVDLPVE